MDQTLIAGKVEQARAAVASDDTDCWITFCRETDEVDEPCLPYILGFDVVWPTAVVVGPEASAVVLGRHDAPNAERLGVHDVYPYDESFVPALREALDSVAADAETVAVNFDRDDNVADGLTHGLYLQLRDAIGDEYEFASAGDVVREVRGLKSATERERIYAAAETTEELLAAMVEAWDPSWTEAEIVDWLHARMTERDLGSAWSWEYCPTVHAGGASEVGHTLPGDRSVPRNELLHVDFGVRQDGYSADIQRLYVRGDVPDGLRSAFEDVRAAIDAGHGVLEAGVEGHEVDTAAREALTDAGWPAFEHAFGHQVGRAAHDGGTLLGPLWDRYGDAPNGEVRVGEIYTMELGVDTEWGYVGQEEMVEITETGTEWVVDPQTELRSL
ncbi:Xaa-Pro peptidase family protein [Haloprofundus sp. MHR1]|uniref:M24 family metallopeptidase n=1 Tax=Haloprofundus sp. MHR1 TaxID=2572921 RepID=UPI0010BE9AF0|nr:M24 family metallopeptidase [Haloprofundus sp. MHR1]QCJ48076.1 aminopeptidase P family protein [Haloprofundus sp. MHR1]